MVVRSLRDESIDIHLFDIRGLGGKLLHSDRKADGNDLGYPERIYLYL